MNKLFSFGITLCLIITVGALGGCPSADTETKARHIRPARATDNTAPTVAMSSSVSDVTDLSPIRVTVTFSESVRGFRTSDLVVTNATVTGFNGDGAAYGFYLVPATEGVVTADIPLAARCLKAGGRVLGTNGRIFSEDSIGNLLATRDLKATLRSAGVMSSGPPPISPKDRSRFLSKLDELVQIGLRESRAK